LNLLLYLNPEWEDSWGGHIELWDKDVKNRLQSYRPSINRCVVFETSDISFHGVAPITQAGTVRRSFAAYYYTREAPTHWKGVAHSTIFRARPNERLRGYVLMPLGRASSVVEG
jgi:Rps23 Pro-64 3,4-dihydroxylase Tpa1-like proline 4-hydroxylase